MEIKSKIYDKRINSWNLLIEVSIREYYDLSRTILKNNDFQRKRVKSSSSVYSLLKSDLRVGCIIPPIVLALSLDTTDNDNKSNEVLIKTISSNSHKLLILDGLQRTYTLRDLVDEIDGADAPEKEAVFNHKLRIEVYIGVNKLGILYRMLTLNTGQTPMSSRHQLEIIYSDYITVGVNGIKLYKEVDEDKPEKQGEYKFSEVIDGFTSYLERDYLKIDRIDILDNIKSLEKLAIENQRKDLFVDFLKNYDHFVKKIDELSEGWEFDSDELEGTLSVQPFGKNVLKIFNKSQSLTGFGSAVGKLLDIEAISSVNDIWNLTDKIKKDGFKPSLYLLLTKLDSIRQVTKKIGNDQRLLFHYFFRELFDYQSDGYLDFGKAIIEAYKQYERKTQ